MEIIRFPSLYNVAEPGQFTSGEPWVAGRPGKKRNRQGVREAAWTLGSLRAWQPSGNWSMSFPLPTPDELMMPSLGSEGSKNTTYCTEIKNLE